MRNFNRPRLVTLLKATAFLLDNSHSRVTGAEFMRELGEVPPDTQNLNDTQRRAFERLKEDLRGLGVPLESTDSDGQAVYWVPPRQYALRDLGLTSEEELCLSLIREVLDEEQSFPLRANLGMALQKISAVARNPFRESTSCGVILGSPDPVEPRQNPEILDRLVAAGGDHHPVSFIYSAFHSETTRKRTVEPYGFFTRRGIWYLVGRDTESDGIKVFRVSRITDRNSVKVHSGERFAVPEGFRLKDYASVPPWNFLSEKPETNVAIEVDADEFWRVKTFCQAHGRVEECVEGKITWRLEVRDFDPLVKWMLPFGSAMFPVEPEEFVHRYREVVRDTLAHYRR